MADVWETAKAAALKILGKDAEVPDLPDTIQQANTNYQKAFDEFDKSREDCESKVLALQDANDAGRNALKQFEAKIEKEDFKLDSKKKEDLQKILKARKLLADTLTTASKNREADVKMLDEVDKHLIQLGKYKQQPPSL